MEHLGNNNESLPNQHWWTYRSLSDEAACLSTSPSVEALILSCIDAVKAKARGLLVSHVSDYEVIELIAMRDRLLSALTTANEDARKDEENNQLGKSPIDSNNDATLRRTVHTILLRSVISEWIQCYSSNAKTPTSTALPTPTSTLDSLLDDFLYSVVVTHAAQWGDDMPIAVWTLLTNVFGMTPLEQEKILPRLASHVWNSFVLELHALEEEGKGFAAHLSHGERLIAAPALVDRAVRVLRMIFVPSAATVSGHVLLPTSAKAKAVVDSLGRWLPDVGECLRVMAPTSKDSEEKGMDNGEALDSLQRTPAARDWARRLQHYVQRLFPVFAQYAETSVWTIPLSNTIARAFHTTKPLATATSTLPAGTMGVGTPTPDELWHESLRAHLVWMSKTSGESTPTGAAAPRSLAEACAMKMGHILSCALDRSVPRSPLSVRLLCVLLVLRPLQTLRHFLMFLCPVSSVAAACDCESAITEKGRGSEPRQRAFLEEPMEDNAVVLTFFPKYFAVFSAVEQALVSLCDGLQDTDAVERYIAAALDEAFSGVELAGSTAASEWLMFLALVCADQPLIVPTALPHFRSAARRFFAPRRVMMAYLHRHIVRLERHGLVAFFLPPLRAIGVDYSTSADAEHVGCAMRYPLSADVAYFQELPRGYYMRQPSRLALNAKNGALQFFHDIFTPPTLAKRPVTKSVVVNANNIQGAQLAKDACSNNTDSSQNQATKEDESNVVRSLFVDIIAHIGAVVATRNVAVTTTSSSNHHRHHPRSATAPKYDPVTIDVMSSVFYGILRLCRSVTYWDSGRRQELQRSIISRLCEVCVESKACCMTNVLGWPISFLLSEHSKANDKASEQSQAPAKNSSKGVDTDMDGEEKAPRSENEERKEEKPDAKVVEKDSEPHAWLDWFHGADFEDIDSRSGPCALALLRACNRDYLKYIPTKTLLTCRAMLEQHASKEKDLRARAVSAIAETVHLDMTSLQRRFKESGAARNGAGNGNSNGNSNGNGLLPQAMPFIAVQAYVDALVSALVCRASVSIVDGLAAAAALRLWVSAAAGHIESHALFETIRRAALRVSTRLTQSTTRLECAALATFLGDLADNIALPYKRSFHPSPLPLDTAEEGAVDSSWIRRALPGAERDASALLRLIIEETSRVVRRFLEERTVLGDWKALVAAVPLRRVLGLVARFEAPFRAALEKRTGEINAALSGATHPVRLLAAMEFPLLPRMTAPTAEVEQLYRQPTAVKPNYHLPAPTVQQVVNPSREQHQPPQESKEPSRRKRSRSAEGTSTRRRTRRQR